jgi:hypothetical protein
MLWIGLRLNRDSTGALLPDGPDIAFLTVPKIALGRPWGIC